MQKTGDRRPGRGAAVQRAQRASRRSPRSTAARSRTARLYAHTIADEIHKQQRALRGVARTKLTFNSDRDGERMAGTVESRSVKEIYIADYDGENQRRVTTSRSLNINAAWSPDARSIAYTSYRRGAAEHLHLATSTRARCDELTKAAGPELAAGLVARRHADRVQLDARRQRRDLRRQSRRLEPAAADQQPGDRHLADLVAVRHPDRVHLRSHRHAADLGDGHRRPRPAARSPRESYADRPTWSPAPFNEIAYAARTGPGLRHQGASSSRRGQVRQLTFGEGTNESPAFAPNGRHLAFTSTRSGKSQIFTIARDGKDLRQITRSGNNYQPDWSK